MSITFRKTLLPNAPPPSRGFLTNSPPPGPTRWQIPDKYPGGMGTLGIDWGIVIIISSKFFFLFIGREPTTWPANNYLQIMVCSCTMLSNCVWLWDLAANNILLIRKRNHAFLLAWKWQIALLPKDIHGDQMIKQLFLNSVTAKYRDLSLSSLCTDPPPLTKNRRESASHCHLSCMGIILHK